MKILLSTDIEGIVGLTKRSLLARSNKKQYKIPCKLMTDEVNVVIRACFDAGADEVLVVDGHAMGRNIIREDLDSRATMVKRKSSTMMMTDIEKVDVAMFIGYHGMASKPNSFCAHTNSTLMLKHLFIDGCEVSEGMTNALIAKHYGVKVIYISGTDVGISELRTRIPSIKSTQNLQSIDMENAVSQELPSHYETIYADVKNAIASADSVEFIDGKTTNINFTIKLTSPLIENKLEVQASDSGYTVDYAAKTITQGYKMYRSVVRSAIRSKNSLKK